MSFSLFRRFSLVLGLYMKAGNTSAWTSLQETESGWLTHHLELAEK